MSQPERYIHIRNWDRYQHPDVTRGKSSAAPWIKDYTAQDDDDDFCALTLAERGLLQSIRRAYARRKCLGIRWDTARISRIVNAHVTEKMLASLNHAGFIVVSASRVQAEFREDSGVDADADEESTTTLTAAAVEEASSEHKSQRRTLAELEKRAGLPGGGDDSSSLPSAFGADSRVTLGANSGSASARAPDPLWNILAELFGPVAERTNAHAKRNKACADLRRCEATVDLVRRAVGRWPQLYPKANLTDIALATHYPQLTAGMLARRPACPECGSGGGLHAADCSRVAQGLEELLEGSEAAA